MAAVNSINSINAQPIRNNTSFGSKQAYIVTEDIREQSPGDSFLKRSARSFAEGVLIDGVCGLALRQGSTMSHRLKAAVIFGLVMIPLNEGLRMLAKSFND